jgi:L-ascorbate metabolism protein UlaG (beta-lactamase superfamily)
MRSRRFLAVIIALSAALPLPTQEPGFLEIEFIGNAAFRITDGHTTLLTDYPYTSGASGYMSYDASDIGVIVGGVSLITHEHADHWNQQLFERMNLRVVANPSITRGLDAAAVVPWSPSIELTDGLMIHPIATDHTAAHSSYRVEWDGVSMYFTGDTEDPTVLLAQRDLDLAFVTPWLLETVAAAGATIDAARIIVHHHATGEDRPGTRAGELPVQGGTFRVVAR